MKILKYIAIALAVLIVGFVALGLFTPTIQYTSTVDVNKPLDESFAVFMDESKINQWLIGLTSIKKIKGEDNAVGSVYEVVMEQEGEVMTMQETITALKENEQFAMIIENDVLTTDMDMRFKAIDSNSTRITSDNLVKGNNVLYRAMFAMMKSNFTEEDQKIMDLLKKVIEDNKTDYFPKQAEMQVDSTVINVQ